MQLRFDPMFAYQRLYRKDSPRWAEVFWLAGMFEGRFLAFAIAFCNLSMSGETKVSGAREIAR